MTLSDGWVEVFSFINPNINMEYIRGVLSFFFSFFLLVFLLNKKYFIK